MTYRKINSFNPLILIEPQFLAQLEPASPNTPETLFTHPDENVVVSITAWSVTSHNNTDITVTLFYDDTGASYVDGTLIFSGVVSKNSQTTAGNIQIPMSGLSSTLGIEVTDIDCTITIWGVIKPKI